jgi:hypothetical protein
MCITNNILVSKYQRANTRLNWHVVELTTDNEVLKKGDRKYSDLSLTLNLLAWTKWWAPASASKWRMGFNSASNG